MNMLPRLPRPSRARRRARFVLALECLENRTVPTITLSPVTAGQFDVRGTHAYAEDTSYTVGIAVTDNVRHESAAIGGYLQTNIVTDNQAVLTGLGYAPAAHTDLDLVNPWGISFNPGQEFWVA